MGALTCISDYLKAYGAELGHRVVDQFPPLHQPSDPVWSAINEPRAGQQDAIKELLAVGARLEDEDYPTGNEEIDAILRMYGAV